MRLLRLCSALVSISLSAIGQTTPTLDWVLEPNPPGLDMFAFAYHGGMEKVVLFGGADRLGVVDAQEAGATWTWDGAWHRLELAQTPGERYGCAMAYDVTRNRLVLFGGRHGSTLLADTWAFDGATWTQVVTPSAPGPRWGHVMSYDSIRDRVVLVGGFTSVGGSFSQQLWEFDGTQWQLVPQAGPAPGIVQGGTAFDPTLGLVLLSGANGFFGWNGVSWQAMGSAGLPAGFVAGQILYDPVAQRSLLVNPFLETGRADALYAWNGSGWSQLGAPPAPGVGLITMVVDPARQRIVGLESIADDLSVDRRSHTWICDGSNWSKAGVGSPGGRAWSAMAYDPLRRRMVLHGGIRNSGRRADTYELSDRTWQLGSMGTNQGLRVGKHGMVFDEARGVTVMSGGVELLQNWVAEWTGSGAWTVKAPAFAPPGRWSPAMAYDSLRQRTLMFGGESLQPALGDFWSWNGTAWTNLSAPNGPPPRRAAAMSYDRLRDRIVLSGGTNGVTTFGDTWEFDGTQWALVSTDSLPARFGHVQVWHGPLQRTVVFGGTSAAGGLRDTWSWDGSAWSEITTAHRPDVGEGVCGAFDSDRRELVVFGGVFARGEVWRLRDPTLGTWASSGVGCESGNGALTLAALDPLAIGGATRLQLTNVPASFLVLPMAWAGFDDASWAGLPLPLPLDILGSPDCELRTEPAIPFYLLATGAGSATTTLTLPPDPSFVGLTVHVQGFAWDFAQPRIATSNLLTTRIGVP